MTSNHYRTAELRKGRYSEPNRIYMITAVTHRRQRFFSDFHSGRCVVKALKAADLSAETLAFVVMPDHLHWLMQLKDTYSLASSVHFVKSTSARLLNRYLGRKGPVWGRGYYDHTLRKEEAIIDCARYIVANPLRAGLVRSVKDYPLWDAVWI